MRRFRESEVSMPSGSVDKPLIEDNRDGTVSVKYEPKEEGLHELVVKYNGENVQGTSKLPEPLPTIPIVDISDQSGGSQASAGFVPTVQPPAGWLQTSASGVGRWRQQQDDPYQTWCPLQSALSIDGDVIPGSSRPTIDRQLCTQVDELKKSALEADVKSKEAVKPEWMRATEEGLIARNVTRKTRPFLSSKGRKMNAIQSNNVDHAHCEVVDRERGSDGIGNKTEIITSISSRNKNDKPSKNETAILDTDQNENSAGPFKPKEDKRSDETRGFSRNPDPFTFGKYPKASNSASCNALNHAVCKHSSAKSGVNRTVFIKERLISSSRGRDSGVLATTKNSGYCICKDFARRRTDQVNLKSERDGSLHTMAEKLPDQDKTGKLVTVKNESCPKDGSISEGSIPQGILKGSKISPKTTSSSDSGKNSAEESAESKCSAANVKTEKTEMSVKFSETYTNDSKSLKTQTSCEVGNTKQRAEISSQTDVTKSPDMETRADGFQTDAVSRSERRPHSTTLVVPARRSSLRSSTTDGGGGDMPGCEGHSEPRCFTSASEITPQPSPMNQPIICSTLSVTPKPRRSRSRSKLGESSDDASFVSAKVKLPSSAAERHLGPDELSLSSRCSAVAESGGFLSASSSNDSLRSALPDPGKIPPPLRPPLGIPMSGARQTESSKRAAERQRRRCLKALEQLGMMPRLQAKSSEAEVASVSWSDGAGSGGGRSVADSSLFRSATSVSEMALRSGGDGNQAERTHGRWRQMAEGGRQRTSADGSPFKFHVDSIASGYVTAHGPGLVHGITGEPANFTISTKDAGAGGLSLAVEGPSKAEISCHDNKDGTVSVSYLPTSPGEYKVAVKFADKHIKGSPYSVKVTGEGRKRNQVSLGSQSEVTLPGKVTEKDIKALNASITAPSGLEEPCFLKKLPNDHLGISFTPREIGQHLVMVKKKGVEISGSPFKIMVSPKEVGDASKVKVSGAALKEGRTHQDNKVLIDTKEAGYGGLSMSIEGPSKAEIKCDDKDDGKLEVSYNPKEPGFYIINLKFADHHVQGSPFTAKVTGEGSNTQTERIKRDRDAAPITTVGSSCALTFKMPGVSALDLSATVASPGGVVEDAVISELEDNLHAVNFVPKELGVHTVSVRYRDVHIPGSPFQFTVGPLKDGGAHRVHAGGPGLERGEQNMPNEFNVWTREAGAGSLAISVEGPSKAEIDFKDRKDGSCYVSYVVSEPGEYRVGVKFNDSHIPESPYKVYVTPANKDAHRVSVNQLPDAGVQVDKPIVFTVDRSGCKGQLDCKVVSPSGHEDDCFAQYLDEDTYSVRFLPKENGIHQLHVKWNNVHVPGSPFRLKIGKQDADPAAVHAHGKGLERGTTGHKSDFIVDTCNAGAGTLAVTIDGPSKVAMDCTEVDEGYKVRYTPLSPGHYYVGVKYDGYHIAGSPFKVDVEGDELAERGPKEQSAVVVETIEKVSVSKQENKGPSMPKFNSDATKVTSKGMGLKKAFVGRQNQFTVDAGKAGQDMLWVGCFGPKNPCEEVHIKHTGRNQYQVFYTVKERGKYILVVRWGEKDIPGSPFEVEV